MPFKELGCNILIWRIPFSHAILQLIFTDKLLLCLITDSTRLWGIIKKKWELQNLSFDTDIDAELSEAAKVTIRPVLFAHGNSNKKL